MPLIVRQMFPERPIDDVTETGQCLDVTFDWEQIRPEVVRFTDRPRELLPPDQVDLRVCIYVAHEQGESPAESLPVAMAYCGSDHRILYVHSMTGETEGIARIAHRLVAETRERALYGRVPDAAEIRQALSRLGLQIILDEGEDELGRPWCAFFNDQAVELGEYLYQREQRRRGRRRRPE